jgi:hypothetical protein
MPPELLNLGVIGSTTPQVSEPVSAGPALVLDAKPEAEAPVKTAAKRGRAPAAKTARAKKTAAASATQGAPKAKRPRAKKTATEA